MHINVYRTTYFSGRVSAEYRFTVAPDGAAELVEVTLVTRQRANATRASLTEVALAPAPEGLYDSARAEGLRRWRAVR